MSLKSQWSYPVSLFSFLPYFLHVFQPVPIHSSQFVRQQAVAIAVLVQFPEKISTLQKTLSKIFRFGTHQIWLSIAEFWRGNQATPRLSVSPNDLSWLFGPCVHVKTYKRQSSAAVTQQNKPNALGKRTLVSGRYDWSNCYNSLLMFFQIRWCYCLRSIRDQNGANNSNAFLKLFFVGQYKGI